MEVIKMNDEYRSKAYLFLDNIKQVTIEENIVSNSSLLLDNDEIQGMMAYEKFEKVALVRYFIFKKSLSLEHTMSLLNSVISDCQKENIMKLIGLVVDDNVEEVFRELGFEEMAKENIYLEENSFINSEYRDFKVYGINIY